MGTVILIIKCSCSLFFRDSLWKAIPNLKIWQQMNTFALGKCNISKGGRKQFQKHLKEIVCITSTTVNVNWNTKDQRFQYSALCTARLNFSPSSWMTINLFWSQVFFSRLSSQKLHRAKDSPESCSIKLRFQGSFPKKGNEAGNVVLALFVYKIQKLRDQGLKTKPHS